MVYDAKKAHDYYIRTRHLKGRPEASTNPVPKVGQGSRVVDSNTAGSSRHVTRKPFRPATAEAQARVARLKAAVTHLEAALSEARLELGRKRAALARSKTSTSTGKSTEAKKIADKQYRAKHKTQISAKQRAQRKAAGSKNGGSSSTSTTSSSSSSTSSSSTSSVTSMSIADLEARIIKINSALANAKQQLSTAQQALGHLAHSDLTSEPTFNEHFARFRSAERRPST